MKTIAPKKAVSTKTDTSVASEAEQTSSNSVSDSSGNPMSVMPDETIPGALGYNDVHCESTKPGKMDFRFMEKETTETPMEVPVHAKGAYPIDENVKEGPNEVPTHAPNTYVPAEEADTKPKE